MFSQKVYLSEPRLVKGDVSSVFVDYSPECEEPARSLNHKIVKLENDVAHDENEASEFRDHVKSNLSKLSRFSNLAAKHINAIQRDDFDLLDALRHIQNEISQDHNAYSEFLKRNDKRKMDIVADVRALKSFDAGQERVARMNKYATIAANTLRVAGDAIDSIPLLGGLSASVPRAMADGIEAASAISSSNEIQSMFQTLKASWKLLSRQSKDVVKLENIIDGSERDVEEVIGKIDVRRDALMTVAIRPFIPSELNRPQHTKCMMHVPLSQVPGRHEDSGLTFAWCAVEVCDSISHGGVITSVTSVDDTFVLFSDKSHAPLFLNYLNRQHNNINFTMENENDRSLSFLEFSVCRNADGFSTSVFRKPTFSGLGISFFLVFVPKSLNLIAL